MSKVGALVFYWSWLEQELTDALRVQCPTRASGTFKERLEAWRELMTSAPGTVERSELASTVHDQAVELRRIRNHVIHGLLSADARPEAGAPSIVCLVGGYEDPTSGKVTYTSEQLEHFAQAMDACRRAFVNVNHFNYRL